MKNKNKGIVTDLKMCRKVILEDQRYVPAAIKLLDLEKRSNHVLTIEKHSSVSTNTAVHLVDLRQFLTNSQFFPEKIKTVKGV